MILTFLPASYPQTSPPSVVLTLWLSMIPAPGARFLAVQFACQLDQCAVHQGQCSIFAPMIEIAAHHRYLREIPWQHAPRYAAAGHIENGIQNLPHIRRTRALVYSGQRNKRGQNARFSIRQITWIAGETSGMFNAGDISPRHCGLHRIFNKSVGITSN